MKVTIIVPTYKDIIALKLILEALETQTYKNFEVIVAEDDNTENTALFLKELNTPLDIKHFTQEDDGNRKAIIINKSLLHVEGEYIIFIDGDVIPFSTFIESHVALSRKKVVLCGRRVNLGDKVSEDLREARITPLEIEKAYFRKYNYLNGDNIRHYEQGIYFNPNSFLYNSFINRSDKNVHILGSNFSCYRDDLFYINGFDEDIIGCSKDDVDLEWRFLQSGCRLKSCKFSANLFHLNHSRNSREQEELRAKEQMKANQLQKKFICTNGLRK